MNEALKAFWRAMVALFNVLLLILLLPYYIVRKLIGYPVKDLHTIGMETYNKKQKDINKMLKKN